MSYLQGIISSFINLLHTNQAKNGKLFAKQQKLVIKNKVSAIEIKNRSKDLFKIDLDKKRKFLKLRNYLEFL
ncbi:MAG: hypothetical protein LBS38_02035 [Endomicrobium sp.]|jgi:hypothetical protein|nr:hypothetical protein [Endomicrobium sp.]